jgi:hypothetical protein
MRQQSKVAIKQAGANNNQSGRTTSHFHAMSLGPSGEWVRAGRTGLYSGVPAP